MKKLSSLTLIELLIVIVIIGILAVALIPRLTGAPASARDAARITHIYQIQTALKLYYTDHGEYPGAQQGYSETCDNTSWPGPLSILLSGGYMSSLPQDPNKNQCYHYSANNFQNGSRYCNNIKRKDYEYTIFFTLEKTRSGIWEARNNNNNTFTHCVAGDLRQ